MPWCPSCESEYDDHVTRCKQCDVDLVENLSEIVHYEKLADVQEEDLVGALEYLKYTGIDAVSEIFEDHAEISVKREDLKMANKHIKVYFYNKAMEKAEEEDEEEEAAQVNDKGYATDSYKNAHQVKEMHSSATSFLAIGGLLVIFGLLNLFGVLKILDAGMYLYGVIVVGIAFCA
ncbi:MAG: hypothetical protein H7X94_03360, partial [Vallitaleaceae bacterium]|nr:hypothetical protein [Vallitaleaceae bacterium]